MRAASANWVALADTGGARRAGTRSGSAPAPTYGHVAALIPEHTAMHVGQLQVIRRRLGKPVLF